MSSKAHITALFLAILLAGCIEQNDAEGIKQKLIGKELEYSSISGDTLTYRIQESDIKSVEKVAKEWKAEIGDALKWNVYLDENGNIAKVEQLFAT